MTMLANDPTATKGIIGGVMAVFASVTLNQWVAIVAIVYNLHLLIGWYWKYFLRDYAITRGWYIPKKKKYRVIELVDDDDTSITKI